MLGISKTVLIAALVLFVFIDLAKSSYIITENFQPWPMQEGLVKWEEPLEYYTFYERLNLSDQEIQILEANYFRSFSHFDTLSNKGSIKGVYDPMGLQGGAVKSKGDPSYKGEYYFNNPANAGIELIKRTANKISLKVETKEDNLLLINQNYHKAWKSKEGYEIISKDSLVAVKIPQGEHTVNLYVFQNKILIGLLLFSIGLVLEVYFFLDMRKSKKTAKALK